MKNVCYCGTRSVYQQIVPAVRSLLTNADVDNVYVICEDDFFPYELPAMVNVVNLKNQEYISRGGLNYHCLWSYMCLMKVALWKVFSDLDKLLVLDPDTIVEEDISELWDLDMTDYYLAAVSEPEKSKSQIYINGGVQFQNLEKLRDGKGEELIHAIDTKFYSFPDQECISEHCWGQIYLLPAEYNYCRFTTSENLEHPKIRHFAGEGKRSLRYDAVRKYL